MAHEYRNVDVKWASKVFSSKTSKLNIGGQVPAGMKRYVTFLCVAPARATKIVSCPSGILYLGSVVTQYPTAASVKAIANRKRAIRFTGAKASTTNCDRPFCDPKEGPAPNSPLFTIAATKYLGATASQQTMNVFMQYYDE